MTSGVAPSNRSAAVAASNCAVAHCEPTISVIIPTKNRSADLQETIRTLLAQTRKIDELIVIDQSKTESFLKSGSLPLKYIYDPRITGASQARNEGMKHATGDVWLFLDDDVILEPDFVEKLLASYAPGVTGVSGIITNYHAPHVAQRAWTVTFQRGPFRDTRQKIYYEAQKLAGSPPIRVRQFGAGLMSFRADAIRGLRFDENLRGLSFAEDIDFCARLPRNSVLVITPQARLVHKKSIEARNPVHWLDLHAQGTNYMRQRHWHHGVGNDLCFAWLNVGYALAALLSAARRMSSEPWKAWKRGAQRGLALGKGAQA